MSCSQNATLINITVTTICNAIRSASFVVELTIRWYFISIIIRPCKMISYINSIRKKRMKKKRRKKFRCDIYFGQNQLCDIEIDGFLDCQCLPKLVQFANFSYLVELLVGLSLQHVQSQLLISEIKYKIKNKIKYCKRYLRPRVSIWIFNEIKVRANSQHILVIPIFGQFVMP